MCRLTPSADTVCGGDMACKVCASDDQQNFPGEINVGFPGIKRVGLSPVYISTELLVCLNCGHTDLLIPATKLERLKGGMDEVRSAGA